MTSEYDVVVIGAGINGAGVAQAAAAAGYRTLLIEKNDRPALETSSRSSKLIHGGLRYLESLEIGLVHESLRERELLIRLAPDLVHRRTFHIPVYRDTRRDQWELIAGLSLYALMAGPRLNRFRRIGGRQARERFGLQPKGLRAVFEYQDAQTDDAALTRAVLRSARELGAELRYSTELLSAKRSNGRIEFEYRTGETTRSGQTHSLVNAAGPWVYPVNQRLQPAPRMTEPDLVQGAHLVLEEPIDRAWYLEAPQDGRAVFLLPWKGHALLGTTETLYRGDPAKVHCLAEERDYLLQVQAHYFPQRSTRVIDDMAGLRVLPAADGALFSRSRETVYAQDDAERPGMVSIVGGKLTVYRKTAEKVLQLLAPSLPSRRRIARTDQLPLSDG